ncbi:MAG: Tat pathway signal sequence, partial [Muribaculaceae bacterium]|nr:Tat pathway signal sequence [Muribaculaceae bacterium]
MDRRKFLKTSGWSLLGLAAASSVTSCVKALGDSSRDSLPADLKNNMPRLDDFNMFIGDIHNHCNVTYGHGDLADAIAAAEQQLDFASITPHALWPDIPGADDPRLGWVIGYH